MEKWHWRHKNSVNKGTEAQVTKLVKKTYIEQMV